MQDCRHVHGVRAEKGFEWVIFRTIALRTTRNLCLIRLKNPVEGGTLFTDSRDCIVSRGRGYSLRPQRRRTRHTEQIVGGGTERGIRDGEERHMEKGAPTDIS